MLFCEKAKLPAAALTVTVIVPQVLELEQTVTTEVPTDIADKVRILLEIAVCTALELELELT